MSVISSRIVGFPNPVNEKAARVVAGLVVLTAVTALVFQAGWLLWLLAAGFLLRVLSGPRFSPFGLLATKVVAPRLGRPKLVPGPPKRFAQGLGLTFSLAAAVPLVSAHGYVSQLVVDGKSYQGPVPNGKASMCHSLFSTLPRKLTCR